MKASQLFAILANHLVEHGDYQVFFGGKDGYKEITHCWYNHGKDWEQEDRIVISSREEK